MSKLLLVLLLFPLSVLAEYQNASKDYQLEFPKDHGAHPQMRIEWWYYTGNLSAQAQEFGYQLTFFRVGERSPSQEGPWSFEQIYFAHFAISDLTSEEFYFRERFGRGSLGRAGAETGDLNTWVGPWKVHRESDAHLLVAEAEEFALRLKAKESEMILHGENGYSAKSDTPGNASHYYSFPRMDTSGEIRIGESTWKVEGLSWMDHEFGSSFLDKGQVGWDWFSLRLDDGSNLMLFRIRNTQGAAFYKGTFHKEGKSELLKDFALKELSHYVSKKSGAKYPISWEVSIPKKNITLTVTARFSDQEPKGNSIVANPTYWEGSVSAMGSHRGEGYLEMTGYSGQSMDRYLSE